MAAIDLHIVHFNTHVRAMKSELLSRNLLEGLLDKNDLDVSIEVLLNSSYAEEMRDALTEYNGAEAIERAVSRNLIKILRILLNRSEGNFRKLVELFLLRWDLASIKLLLRNKYPGALSGDDKSLPIPGPILTDSEFEDMNASQSFSDLVTKLILWNPDMCSILNKQSPNQDNTRGPGYFEDALDRSYFLNLSKVLNQSRNENALILFNAFQMEIDRLNLRILLQNAGEKSLDISEHILPFGSLPPIRLKRIIEAENVAQAIEPLIGTPYQELVEFVYQYMQTRRFSPLDRMIEHTMIRRHKRVARQHVLTIAVLISYVWLKYNEVTNLKLITRGQAQQLPRGRVREELIYA